MLILNTSPNWGNRATNLISVETIVLMLSHPLMRCLHHQANQKIYDDVKESEVDRFGFRAESGSISLESVFWFD